MGKNKVALILGGVVPHIELVYKLKERGYYTIIIDYYRSPPAAAVADEHIMESTLDIEKVLEIARDRKAELVIGLCVDHANVTACYVSEKLGLPKPYSYETSLLVTNKGSMKKIMAENGIPTSRYDVFDSEGRIEELDMQYPLVVKPVDNNGSKGVKKVSNFEELKKSAEYALSISRCGKVIVEEFNEGYEIQIDCFVKNHETNVIMIKKRFKILDESGNAMQSFGSITPFDVSDNLGHKISQIAAQIAKACDLNNTPFFIQAIVNGEDIKVIEFAPRIGGTTSFSMIKMVTGFDIIEISLKALLGENCDVKFEKPDKYVSTVILYAYHGVFDRIEGIEEVKRIEQVKEFYVSAIKGNELGSQMDSRNRVGSFIVTGSSKAEIAESARKVLDTIDIYDSDDRSIMRKDLYPTIEMM